MPAFRSRGLFDGCLLLSDIDGTLVHEGRIPERNLAAIDFFIKHGGLFSIATGRSVEATRLYAVQSGANAGVVTCNGAVIYDYAAEQPIFSCLLPEKVKPLVRELVQEFPLVGAEAHHLRELYLLNRTDAIDHHMSYEQISALSLAEEEIYEKPWTKVLFATFDPEDMSRLHTRCRPYNCEDYYFLETADIYYELTCGGANKGAALSRLAEHYHIPHRTVFAIGDYFNDVEMLDAAGISAAPSGAPEEIKARVDFIAGRCEDGCVADFIDYLRLKLQD